MRNVSFLRSRPLNLVIWEKLCTLRIDENAQPTVLRCRKIPLVIEDAVKEELDRLVEKDVLVPVTEPTDWVSQMAVVHKPSGKH